tara:strand:- start:3254 stop:3616 length:363 start_codon:yes stop_codon:yes gene_type:complete
MSKGVIILLLLSISGCSSLGMLKAVNPLKDPSGISATAQIGKENASDSSKQLVKSNIGSTNRVTGNQSNIEEKNEVTGTQTITKTTNVPWWSALLLLFVRPLVVLRDALDLFRGKKDETT